MPFPATRLRRLRATPVLRDLVRETRLDAADMVLPLFVQAGDTRRTPIASLPSIERLSISAAVEEAGEAAALGLPAVLLFGIPDHKDAEGTGAYDDEGIVQLATRAISSTLGSLSTVPSARSRPQCPWSVYSQRHTSVMTTMSGWASLIARVASWTIPSSS